MTPELLMTSDPDIWRIKIRKLEFIPVSESGPGDLTAWFEGIDEPFSLAEFRDGSPTREHLEFLSTLLNRVINL